jgi:hypothetical protein
MGIFKSFRRILKKAAPVIGGTLGFAIGGPMGSAALGAALGSGIGSLAAGGDTDDALKAALFGGIGGYAASGGNFFTPKAAALPTQYGSGAMATGELADVAVKSAEPSFFQKAVDFAKENPKTALGLGGAGVATLAALGAEEPEQEKFEMRPFPKGETRLGMGQIGNKFYNLDNKEEREQYFEDLRKKRKTDDEVGIPEFSRGGLNALGSQIANQITQPIQGKMSQIQPFLEEVKSNAEQKFGVTLNGQGGGMGLNQLGGGLVGQPATIGSGMNQLGRPLPTQNTSSLFDQMQNRFGNQTQTTPKDYSMGGPRPAYLPMDDDGDGIDQFGAVMPEFEANPLGGMTEEEGNKFLSDVFNQGVTQSVGAATPFGSGQSRLGGLGAIGNLFMNTGGEVNGPGTGTSDSVPARLSDGEFVLTAKAVRGAGGGDRDIGAARMYEMMSELERVA